VLHKVNGANVSGIDREMLVVFLTARFTHHPSTAKLLMQKVKG
jgi:hypothetical protein